MIFDILLSYAYHGDSDLGEVRKGIGPNGLLCIDSGAFTAFNTGKTISLDAYMDYLSAWEGVYSYAITLDVIGDPKATQKNTEKLHDAGFPVLPVFTIGDDAVKFRKLCQQNPFVAVGGIAKLNTKTRLTYLHALNTEARKLGSNLHALGVGGPTELSRLGLYAADSSNYATKLNFGHVHFWDGKRMKNFQLGSSKAAQYRDVLASYDVDLAKIINDEPIRGDHAQQMKELAIWAYARVGMELQKLNVSPPRGSSWGNGTRLLFAVTKGDLPLFKSIFDKANAGQMPDLIKGAA